ncbi:hypothetical protein HUK76_20420 [Citrobacter portucalensis]|uniref:hypothetical protein n=1 Tax=Citrobacter portucalensis TaxID=1639133 RepID=UPI00157FD9EF|nr:hypothetical protein [Citrobacter portucalensis]NUH56021.1 hypothetical protein [Citrobacter portucalensis]
MKRIVIKMALLAPCSAFAGIVFHPVESATVVANSNHHPTEVVADNCNDNHCVQKGSVIR